ncbi:hypothetical protein, partial [Vibrio vulnificus]|uniref:hypothetical protein n=1 Tax=Vibrio vulnificus TaxID=672 RepID=UPI001C6280AB
AALSTLKYRAGAKLTEHNPLLHDLLERTELIIERTIDSNYDRTPVRGDKCPPFLLAAGYTIFLSNNTR